ncbi:hypothetical protein ACLMJK_009523 [Lecanora helva]
MATAHLLVLTILLKISIALYIPLSANHSLLQPSQALSTGWQWPAEGEAFVLQGATRTSYTKEKIKVWLRIDQYGGTAPSESKMTIVYDIDRINDQLFAKEESEFGDLPATFNSGPVTIHIVPIETRQVDYGTLNAATRRLLQFTWLNGARGINHASLELESKDAARHDVVALRLDIDLSVVESRI